MARELKLAPFSLHKIHTDNVTLPFLAFVSQLDHVTELLLMERTQKARVESTTAKTTVTMDQIRRIVLKKHAATLKVLMLRNEAGMDWDLNAKTVMLLCHRAKLLEELAVSCSAKIIVGCLAIMISLIQEINIPQHTFLQFMPGLTSLRAFHTIQFRTDDVCVWVYREFRKFTVDNISHNPDMKLEYIAVDNSVERLVRRVPVPKQKVDTKGKGKDISDTTDTSSKKTFTQIVLGSEGMWPDGSSMSTGLAASMGTGGFDFPEESEDDTFEWGVGINGKIGLKVETIEGLRFSDITGVRIFENEILGGRL